MIMNNRTTPGARRFFKRIASRYKHKPIAYLEIGLWVGACAAWMCENILTHTYSMGYGIDPFIDNDEMGSFTTDRLSKYPNFKVCRNLSWDVLTCWHGLHIDFLYIDGDHTAVGCLQDWVAAWHLLKIGGIVILDDNTPKVPGVPKAIEAIKLCYSDSIEQLNSEGYQIAFRRIK